MEKLFIIGGNRLEGEVWIDSAKNALLPIIACCLQVEDEVLLKDVPMYKDVETMCEILRFLGAKVERKNNDLYINCKDLSQDCIPNELSSAVRSSIFALGPLLGRLGSAKVAYPGGCDIGLRPIDLHLKGLRELGAKINEKNGYIYANGQSLTANDVMLSFPSVGATENIMMLALSIDGQTRICNAAREPEIVNLQQFINAAGGCVEGAGSNTIVVKGGRKLHGCVFKAISDRIETGTYIIGTAMCGGKVVIHNAIPSHNRALLSKLSKTTCKIDIKDDNILVESSGHLLSFGDVETAVYPGFPTDLQAQMSALASVSEGCSLIVETLFEARNKHIGQLLKMGCDIRSKNGVIIIKGREKIYGADVCSTDLRGGASLILAGIKAEGYTTVSNVELVDRGYYKIEEKLNSLGCNIKRIQTN